MPTRSQTSFAEIETAIEGLKQTRQALVREMLSSRDVFLKEGERTGELIDLHGKFIHLMQEKAQLEIGRRMKTVLDAESFRNAYRVQTLQCCSKPPDFVVRRRVFLSRSY